MRVALLGGGGFRVPLLFDALLASGIDVHDVRLHDVSGERLDVMASVLGRAGPHIETTTDLDTAVEDCDLVFAAIRAGGVDGRVRDERDALDAGVIGQETVGAGGLASILRVVPQADLIAERIATVAPDAWTITMTNPAGAVTRVMAERLGSRVIGVCDSPVGLARRATAALGIDPGPSLAGVTGVAELDYLGLNHLGWLRALAVDGVDRLPELLASDDLLARFEEGRLFGADVLRALGAVPNEYLYWYYARREALRGITAAGRTRAEHVRERQTQFYAAAAADPRDARRLWHAANDERNRSYLAELREDERDDVDVAAGGYESVAVALAGALSTPRGSTPAAPQCLILNVRNDAGGAVPVVADLPGDAVVETVCDVDSSGAVPRGLAPLRGDQLGLVVTVEASQRAAIAAARSGSADEALRAFVLDPLVDSLDAARTLSLSGLRRAQELRDL